MYFRYSRVSWGCPGVIRLTGRVGYGRDRGGRVGNGRGRLGYRRGRVEKGRVRYGMGKVGVK